MKLGYKIKPRDAKSNPTTAILAAVFVMFLISGLLLLLLALLLYKMEPGESVNGLFLTSSLSAGTET